MRHEKYEYAYCTRGPSGAAPALAPWRHTQQVTRRREELRASSPPFAMPCTSTLCEPVEHIEVRRAFDDEERDTLCVAVARTRRMEAGSLAAKLGQLVAPDGGDDPRQALRLSCRHHDLLPL